MTNLIGAYQAAVAGGEKVRHAAGRVHRRDGKTGPGAVCARWVGWRVNGPVVSV